MLQSVQSPTHLSHTTLSQPFQIKRERYIFLKKCVRSFIIVDFVSACICIRIVVSYGYTTHLSTCVQIYDTKQFDGEDPVKR